MNAESDLDTPMEQLDATQVIGDIVAPYRRERPASGSWVRANMVAGLDGSASIDGRVRDLSDGIDAVLFRHMRATADVVLVGAQTVRAEGYGAITLPDDLVAERLDAGRPATPPFAIVTSSLDLDWSSPIFSAADRPYILTGSAADPDRLERASAVADVIVGGQERVDLGEALAALAERGHRLVHCEGGPSLLGELVHRGLLDELCLTVAPLMGGDPFPISLSPAPGSLVHFALAHTARAGDVLFLRYERRDHG